jgi:hypothetical protein
MAGANHAIVKQTQKKKATKTSNSATNRRKRYGGKTQPFFGVNVH